MTSRTSKLLSVMVLAACLSGCVMFDMKEKPEPDKIPATTTMVVDEVRTFPFPPDGEWHYSDIQVGYHDLLLIEPVGDSDGLTYGTITCRSGLSNPALYVDGGQSIRFEHYGPLQFRCSAKDTVGFPGPVEVKITKREGRRGR
jgi:hypothetical protein